MRCGRCDEVFLASRHLLEGPLEQAATGHWPAEPTPGSLGDDAPRSSEPTLPPLDGAPTVEPNAALTAVPNAAPPDDAGEVDWHHATPAAAAPPWDDEAPSGREAAAQPLEATAGHLDTPSLDEQPTGWRASVSPNVGPATAQPYSWERAHRVQPASSAAARAAWAGVLVLGLIGLGAQSMHAWRDHLAAALPAARPLLTIWCGLASCRIEPLRRIGALSVESSQLRQMGGTIYRLDVVIRNRADLPLMMPSLDLALTDARGQLLSRKALELGEFGLRSRVLGAGQELAILASVNAGTTEVAGYTIEIFHP